MSSTILTTCSTALSDEQKEKIEKVRSSMILKHLSKFTLTINEENMTATTTPNSAMEKESRESCILVEQTVCEKDDEEEDEVDIEKGALITQYSHICVPLPGEQRDNSSSTIDNDDTATSETIKSKVTTPRKSRQVPNLCVICHEDYSPFDKVCWASSEDCTHVFHEECIVRWLTSLGWMKLKGQNNDEPENMIEEEKCLNYDLECPMCRGEFICKESIMNKKKPPVITDVVEYQRV